ncbi:hypothetical protein [Natrononativus amylolyticus]|uniref:hypothetical protein n=1 Tax=Natrononativus amylolyticus TaxID=2963434 RepID=UPI0020CDF946|nr:hypothetical protein [Natrononativus amylolyticus]
MLLIGGIVLSIVVLVYVFPDETRTWWTRVYTTKEVMFGAAGLILAYFLIQTGNLWFVLLGVIGIAYGVLWIVFERPDEKVKHTLRG